MIFYNGMTFWGLRVVAQTLYWKRALKWAREMNAIILKVSRIEGAYILCKKL